MRQFIVLLSFFTGWVIISACNDPAPKKFEFFYYPSKNVYYNVSNSLYLYSLDGGKNWDSFAVKTNKEPATLGTKRILYSTSLDIWKDNEQHLREYNGQAINITGNDSSNLQTDLAADRKIKKAKTTPAMNVPKPEKKPNFFQRLFGKKRNNN